MLSTTNTSDAVVKVIDFGTAQVLDEHGNPTVALGGGRTEAYCPPEALKQRRITNVEPSMDMWALGVILYIMLVGAHPFDLNGDATEEEITSRVISGEPIPLEDSEYASHLSEASADLIRKLLAYRTEDRITAHELFQHPWVQGITASHTKIEESNNKLKNFRKIKSKLEVKVFEDMFMFSEDKSDATNKMSLIERSFRNLDTENKGFITAKDMGGEDVVEPGADDEGEALSLSAFSTLLSDSMKNEYYNKGDVIYREGDKGHDMLFINSGVIEVTNKAGFRTTLKQGDFVGEGSLLSDKPRSGTVKCMTPVHAIKITKEYFDKYLSTSESGISLKMLEKDKDRENSRIIFSAFSELISENMKNEHFEEGGVVYREGEKGDDVFFINSGVVEVSNKDGFRTTLQQGDFVGEGALLSNKPRSGTVVCLTPVDGMKISKAYFDKYLASSNSDLSLKMRERDRDRSLSRTNMVLRKHSINQNASRLGFSSGDFVYREGDLKKSLYIVEEGIVELVVAGHPVLKLKSGDIFGEHSIIFDRPRNASARCVTGNCKVIEIEGKAVNIIFAESSSLRDSVKESSLRRDFQKAVVFKTRKEFPKTYKALKAAFKAVTPTDEITLPMMSSVLRNMNPEIQDEDIKAVFDSIDMDRQGSIDFATFKLIFGF
jgi:CRP-like cAMP-binding protein